MNAVLLSILVGVLGVGVAWLSYQFSVRAHKEQARATQLGVDASAFVSAKDIYEGALEELRIQIAELRAETARLRESNLSLEASNRQLDDSNRQLKASNLQLGQEVERLHTEVASLRRSRGAG